MTQLRSVTCHMGSHSFTCYPTQVNTPRLNPSHAGWYSIYLPRRDGRLSWPRWLDSTPAGSRTSDLPITSPTLNHCNHQDNQRHHFARYYFALATVSTLFPVQKGENCCCQKCFCNQKLTKMLLQQWESFPRHLLGWGRGKKHPPTHLIGRLNFQRLWCFDSWFLDTLPWYSVLKVGDCGFVLKWRTKQQTIAALHCTMHSGHRCLVKEEQMQSWTRIITRLMSLECHR